jgi:hypothetical protein
MLPCLPLRLADGIGNVFRFRFINRLVFRYRFYPLFILRFANGIRDVFRLRFPNRFADIVRHRLGFCFPDRLANGVVNLLCSDFGNVFAVGYFAGGRNFFIDRFVTRHLLLLIDDLSAGSHHRGTVFNVIGTLRGTRAADTGTAKARLGGTAGERQKANGQKGESKCKKSGHIFFSEQTGVRAVLSVSAISMGGLKTKLRNPYNP